MNSEEIRKIRKSTDLTQDEFCDKYGVGLSALRTWEQGTIPLPKLGEHLFKSIKMSQSSDSFDFNMELDIGDFNINVDIGEEILETRYIKPILEPEIKEEYLQYSNAVDMAMNYQVGKNSRLFAFVTGTFYFGDFIEALIIEKDLKVKTLTVSTLSLNDNNVDSFANIMNGGFCDKLNLIVSHYFFSHERRVLVPYIYQELDKEDRFQLVVCRSHCKMALIELYSGEKIVIHGSANLRSSGNVEQLMIEENEELYDFSYNYQRSMIKRYKTIDYEG